jgi:hypothetical protein
VSIDAMREPRYSEPPAFSILLEGLYSHLSRGLRLIASLIAGLAAMPLHGADKPPVEPRVTAISPLAVPQGFAGRVRLRGFRMKEATEVRVDKAARPAKIEIKEKKDAAVPAGMEKDLCGESEVIIELALAADAAAGPLPLVVVVGDLLPAPVTLRVLPVALLAEEREPNNGFRSAMKVEVPGIVTGLIKDPRDVDVFEVATTAGKTVRVSVIARGVASLLDPLLTAYDAHGHQLAVKDDAATRQLDATLEVTAAADGPIYLVVQDALDFGSEWHAYRLEVGPGKPETRNPKSETNSNDR